MEIYLDKRAIKQIKLAAQEAIDEGDTDPLREEIIDAFSDEQIEEIERRIDTIDFNEFVGEILDEWAGDELDELFEILEGHLAEAGIEVKYASHDMDGEDADDDDDDDLDDDDDEEEEEDFEPPTAATTEEI